MIEHVPVVPGVLGPAQFDAEQFDVDQLADIVLGGHVRLTLRSKKTEARRTYEVLAEPVKDDQRSVHMVRTLYGSNNSADYVRLGLIFERRYYYNGATFKYPWGGTPDEDSVAHKAFQYFWSNLMQQRVPPQLEVFLARQCIDCNLWLTVPESIIAGRGPTCAARASRGGTR